MQVNRYYGKGDLDAARMASVKAEVYTMRAFTSMFLVSLIMIIFFLACLVLLLCFAIDCHKTSCDWS